MVRKFAADLGTALVCVAISVVVAGESKADVFGFTRIEPSNASVDVASQLSVKVTDEGSNQVLFTFEHDAGPGGTPNDATIAQIYFDDDASILSSLAGIRDYQYDSTLYPEVDFEVGANPSHLPGGDNLVPSFAKPADRAYGARQQAGGAPKWGVDPGESVGLLFNIDAGSGFSDVIGSITAGALRAGLHVISIAPDGESDAFVSTAPVPVPGAFLLGSLGLGFAGWLRKRQNA